MLNLVSVANETGGLSFNDCIANRPTIVTGGGIFMHFYERRENPALLLIHENLRLPSCYNGVQRLHTKIQEW